MKHQNRLRKGDARNGMLTTVQSNLAPQQRLPPEFDSPWAQQDQVEFFWLLSEMAGSASILEIGSCYGNSLRLFALAMRPQGRVTSIDLGTLPPQSADFCG